MAEDHSPQMPQPPQGFQRPGVPGAGNILDPEVRGRIREVLHPAVHEAARLARGEHATENPTPASDASVEASSPPGEQPRPAHGYRAGPYPHGDVDLRFIAANVPPEPVRPRRGGAGRRYYFLRAADVPAPAGGRAAVPAPALDGPKRG